MVILNVITVHAMCSTPCILASPGLESAEEETLFLDRPYLKK